MKVLTIQEAEAISKHRLDRRRLYATTDDGLPDEVTGSALFELGRWTGPCSGCSCDGEYPYDCCKTKGAGSILIRAGDQYPFEPNQGVK